MHSLRRFLTLLLALGIMLALTLPSLAADPPGAKQELKKVTPRHYSYIFSVAGGAALGAGVGAILGHGVDLAKGALIGGGGISDLYLTSYPNALGAYRSWAFILSDTALGSGIGWTLCGCNNGLAAGALVGGGGTAAMQAWHAKRDATTANAQQRP